MHLSFLYRRFRCELGLIILLLLAAAALAQSGPEIALEVDATQAPMKIIRTHMTMPVKPGPLTLYYPKWIPGEHQPAGPIGDVAGLKFSANGKNIPWQRDLLDVFTFHVNVPPDVRQLEVSFELLDPNSAGPGRGSATDKLLVLSWNTNVLYPAGYTSDQITYRPTLRLPQGWKFGTALPVASASGETVEFKPVTLERLVDSPVLCGEYYRAIDLTPPGEPIHHEIDMVADSSEALEMPADVQRGLTNLVAQAGKLFGSRHYRDYHFLLTLSDHTPHFGLEHNESNDSRLPERVLLSPDAAREVGSLLAHEYAHSWNGKFRRPKDLTTPDFQKPMETDLLWVYEGNTSFLGDLLATRSGMWTPDDYRQTLATVGASLGQGRPGRTWRPLVDTAVAIPGMFRGGGWGNWRRGSDYYEEGELIWLEVANIIHDRSHGQKSFEDFYRAFYGGPNNGPEVKPYTFEDLVNGLNQVVPYDWASFFHERLTSNSPQAPLNGIEEGGWKLEFSPDKPKAGRTGPRGPNNTTYTIGLSVDPEGMVTDSIYDGPAFKAGISPGMKIVGVNGRLFTPQLLADAITASKDNSRGIEFLLVDDDYYRTANVDYHGGDRYPHLVRDDSKPDYIDELVKPD